MVEVPSGTVTLLFTDIEGSTRLLKQLRKEYGDPLAEHHRVMRAALEQHAGREMDTQGEAFFAVFSRAKDAVASAIAAQRDHATHDWPDQVKVRVRMGLHTAEPEVLGDRYFGLGVHRAARLCAVGHGGQILLSRSTAGLVDEDEVAGVAVRDLGEHLLKDLDRPERIYQLLAEGLAQDFPPIRTVTEIARLTEVPSGTVSFVTTDMVGFRRLFDRESDFAAAVLEEYDRLLRNVFAEKGYVVEVVGDAFVAAFTRAKDAVHAAAAAQQALESGDWPEGGQPQVKFGIHTGEALRIASRYLSLTLLRAFHVCEAAAGGQVVLSQVTESLLDANDLVGLKLHDLGTRELPEFERPVQLYEVVTDSATSASLGGNHATAR